MTRLNPARTRLIERVEDRYQSRTCALIAEVGKRTGAFLNAATSAIATLRHNCQIDARQPCSSPDQLMRSSLSYGWNYGSMHLTENLTIFQHILEPSRSATRSLIFAMAEKIRIFGENLQQSCFYRYSRVSAARSALRQGWCLMERASAG